MCANISAIEDCDGFVFVSAATVNSSQWWRDIRSMFSAFVRRWKTLLVWWLKDCRCRRCGL